MDVVEEGIRRTTFPLSVRASTTSTATSSAPRTAGRSSTPASASREPAERWRPVLDELDAPVERDRRHAHASRPRRRRGATWRRLTGAPVLQGRADYEQCVSAWGERDPQRFVDYWVSHGMPQRTCAGIARESERLVAAVHWVRDPQLLDAGDEIDGWRVEVLPRARRRPHRAPPRRGDDRGRHDPRRDHARDRPVSRTRGPTRSATISRRWSGSRRSRRGSPTRGTRSRSSTPRAAPARSSSTIRERLDGTAAALDGVPLSAYDVSLALFERDLSPVHRRFATAESLAHLERLVREGRAQRASSRRLHQRLIRRG